MIKMILKAFRIFISAIMIISIFMQFCLPVLGVARNSNNLYDYSEINAEFADDRILVVLTQTASLQFLEYSSENFSEIGCKFVTEMTPFIVSKAREVISEGIAAIQNRVEPIIDTRLDLSGFKNVLCLGLQEPGKENVINAINKLLEREDVLSAMPDYLFTIETESSTNYNGDSAVYTTWNRIDELIEYSNALEAFHEVYDSSDFDQNEIRVAVLDTGIDTGHPDFKYSLDDDHDANFCEYTGDGSVTDDQAVNAMTIANTDENGHGTHVAGIIAKITDQDIWEIPATNNLFGVVRFVSVKAFNHSGEAHASRIIAAINYINSYYGTSNEISVINFSAGARWNFIYFDRVNAINAAIEGFQGLFVCAAGNNGSSIEGGNVYPAVLDTHNLITVGASDPNDNIYTFSNYGATTVDIFAPGENILSTFLYSSCRLDRCQTHNDNEYAGTHVDIDIDGDGDIDPGYHSLSGTSMATPFVSGVAALIYALQYDLSAAEIKNIIVNSDDPVTSMQGKCVAGGRLNAYKAVQAAIDYNTTPCTHSNATYTYTADTHTFTCPDCSYTFTEPHNDFTYTSNNANTHTRRCSDCPHTLIEAHNDFSYTYNAYTHSLKCSDCPYITGNAVHTGSYVTYDANTHTYSCSVCSYSLSSAHELYVYSDNGEDGVTIKCNTCNYMRTCYVGVAEYGSGGDNGHYVSCTCGCYNFLSPHIPAVITSTGDLYTHQAFCRDCGVYYQDAHSWVAKSYGTVQGYECLMCNMFSISVPGIMQIPSGDEILIASGDENGTAIALLPEKEDDLVTE